MNFFSSNAQPTTTFERIIGSEDIEYGSGICHDSNFNYYVAGSFVGASINWDYDLLLTKLDSAGNVLWSKHYGDSLREQATAIKLHPSGDLFVLGISSNLNTEEMMLSRIDTAGNLIWMKKYGPSVYSTFYYFNHMEFLPNNCIAIAGRVTEGINGAMVRRGIIEVLDTSGNLLNSRTYYLGESTEFTGMKLTNDNLLTLCANSGNRSNSNYNYILLKADLNGDTLWSKKYSSLNNFRSKGLVEFPNSELVIGGEVVQSKRTFYHFMDSLGNSINFVQSTETNLDMIDLEVSPATYDVYSLVRHLNYNTGMAVQKVDSTGTISPIVKYFNIANISYAPLYTILASDLDLYETISGLPCLTIAGSTTLGYYQNSNIAIVHTYDSLRTISEFNHPVISAKPSPLFCSGDSILITQDSGFYPINHWVDIYTGNIDSGTWNDSLYVNDQTGIVLVSMDADSNVFLSNIITTQVLDETRPVIGISFGNAFYCSNSQSGPHLEISNFSSDNNYQWYRDTVAIIGSVGPGINPDTSGIYFCRGFNGCGFLDSQPIIIDSQHGPDIGYFYPGIDATWCADIESGSYVQSIQGVHYQWYFQNNIITGDTSNYCSQHIPGTYKCLVWNDCGIDSVEFDIISLLPSKPLAYGYWCSVGDTLLIQSDHQNDSIVQWYLNGAPLPGVSGDQIMASLPGVYSFDYFTSTCTGVIQSDTLNLQFSPIGLPDSLVIAVDDTIICNGTSREISVNDCYGARIYWLKDGQPFTNTIQTSITVSQGGNYSCYVFNNCDTLYSDSINMYLHFITPVDLGNDTVLCNNDAILLCADTIYDRYFWNTVPGNYCTVVYPPALSGQLAYRLTVNDIYQCQSRDTITIFFDYCLNADEEIASVDYTIFPNPFTSTINLPETIDEFRFVKLYSSTGLLVHCEKIGNETLLNLSKLNSGLYFIEVYESKNIFRKKVLKIN